MMKLSVKRTIARDRHTMAVFTRTRRFQLLMAASLAVLVGWSIAWFIIATYVDRHVERAQLELAEANIDLECAQRKVTGFPFRIELRCAHGSHLTGPTGSARLEGATVAALIYRPSRLIMELQGPLSVQSPFWDGLAADWSLARASARVDLDAQAMTRFDAEVIDLDVAYGDAPGALIRELDVNLRAHPANPTDLQFSVRMVGVEPEDGPVAGDIRVSGVLENGAMLTQSGGIPAFIASGSKGLRLAIDGAVVEIDGVAMAAEADLLIDHDGRLNGTLDLALAGAEDGLPFVETSDGNDVLMAAFHRAVAAAPEGEVAGVAGRTMQLTLRRGQVMMGILPLPMRVPPLRLSSLRTRAG